jgi:hypothetical protein
MTPPITARFTIHAAYPSKVQDQLVNTTTGPYVAAAYNDQLMAILDAHDITGAAISRVDGIWEGHREIGLRCEIIEDGQAGMPSAVVNAAHRLAEAWSQDEVWVTTEWIGFAKVRP